jgi:spermidine synthase
MERRILGLAAVFVLPSGAAALINQVVWVRLLGLSVGSASASVATVVAAFFLGLAIGSAIAPRLLARWRDPLSLYIALEAGIAVCSLLLLPALSHLDTLVAGLPLLGSWGAARFALVLLLLAPPTICMGATYPVIVAWAVRSDQSVGHGISLLYAMNTLGAVLGACGSGFVLIPWLGLDGAVLFAAALGAGIVALGLLSRGQLPAPTVAPAPSPQANRDAQERAPERVAALAILAGTGFGSVASEVGWTHVLSILTGTTLYGFSAILTAYLIGIAAGSYWVRRRVADFTDPAAALSFGLVALTLGLLLTRGALTTLPAVFDALGDATWSETTQLALRFSVAGGMILLPTLLYGALFPMSLTLYCGGQSELTTRLGRAYAVNTVGGILGSLLAAFVLIPRLGTNTLLTGVALLTLAMAFLPWRALSSHRRRTLVGGTVAALGIAAVTPSLDWIQVLDAVRYDEDIQAGRTPETLFLAEGHSGVIRVISFDERRHAKLMNNGLNESFVCLEDEDHETVTESLLGLVPWLWHGQAESAFVIGLGGGVTTRALARTPLDRIRVVELEAEVVAAMSTLGRAGEKVLYDPRVDLRVDDARHQLLTSQAEWDLIVSQPSHPWKSGASHLFTGDFFELVSSRLRPGGIFGQWINLFRMDVATLRSLLGTFFDVFEGGFVMINPEAGDLLVFGANEPLTFDRDGIAERLRRPAVSRLLTRERVETPEQLLQWFALSRDEAVELAAGAERVRDMNILPEVRLATVPLLGVGEQNPQQFVLSRRSFDLSSWLDPAAHTRTLQRLGRHMRDRGDNLAVRQIQAQLAGKQATSLQDSP